MKLGSSTTLGKTSNLPNSREANASLFLKNPDLRFNSRAIEISTTIPDVQLIKGQTQDMLRSLFKGAVHWNDYCLELAFINRHSFAHMDRIASGAYQLGLRLPINHRDVQVATLATRFHDVGYDFPRDKSEDELSRLGKEMHKHHAANGADMFVETIEELHRSGRYDHEIEWWNSHYSELAHQTIRLHSNDSTVTSKQMMEDTSIHPVALVTRFIDKLDQVDRVYPSHMEALAAASHHTVQGIRHRVRGGVKQNIIGEPKKVRRHKDTSVIRQSLEELDSYPYHRLAPYAITDQHLYLSQADGVAMVHYAVHPSQVTSALGLRDYTNEQHFSDFRAAYDKSMQNAAATWSAIHGRLLQTEDAPRAPELKVVLSYENGEEKELSYKDLVA